MDVPDPKRNHDQTRNIQESKENPNLTINDFKQCGVGGTVQKLSELSPDAQLKPVCIPVRRGDVLAIPSFLVFLPHSGPSVPASRESADLFLLNQRYFIAVLMY